MFRSVANDGGEWLGEKIYFALLFIPVLFLLLVWCRPEWGIWSTEPAVIAIVATVGALFGYGQLMPPSYFPAFEVADKRRIKRLAISEGQETPVKVVVHNTGIGSN